MQITEDHREMIESLREDCNEGFETCWRIGESWAESLRRFYHDEDLDGYVVVDFQIREGGKSRVATVDEVFAHLDRFVTLVETHSEAVQATRNVNEVA